MTSRTSYADRMRAQGLYPAVLRFAAMRPEDAAGLIRHGERTGGDLDHVDPSRTHLNRPLVGGPGVAREIVEEARAMAEHNHASRLLGLDRAGRRRELKAARREGPKDPWSRQIRSRGPLREVVLTVHRECFHADAATPREERWTFLDDEGEATTFDSRRVEAFVSAGQEFLIEAFGGSLRILRADLDEQSVHLHGLIACVVEEPPSVRHAMGRQMYRPSSHPLLASYEAAQDAVAEHFARPEHAALRIVRGEPRAAHARAARATIAEAREEAEFEGMTAIFGPRQIIPGGSPNAQAMWLLRRRAAEAKDGRADKVREVEASAVALDLLELAGVIAPRERAEASTRRARRALLDRHAGVVGSAAEILADPDAAAARALAAARDRIVAEAAQAAEARRAADAAAEAERARRGAQAAARRRAEDEAVAARRQAEDEARAAAARAQAEREAALAAREREIGRREAVLREAARALIDLGDQVRAAAARVGLLGEPVVRGGLAAAARLRPPRERERGR